MQSGHREVWRNLRESMPDHVRTLFDRYHLCDVAFKVVGVGSLGTRCAVALFVAADDDPLFLQMKEARASVLEPYAGKSLRQSRPARRRRPAPDAVRERHVPRLGAHDGRLRRLCAPASRHEDQRHHRGFRRRRSPGLRTRLRVGAVARPCTLGRCGHDLRLHGGQRDFDEAITDFAAEYADQAHKDHRAFLKAIRSGPYRGSARLVMASSPVAPPRRLRVCRPCSDGGVLLGSVKTLVSTEFWSQLTTSLAARTWQSRPAILMAGKAPRMAVADD